MATARLLICEKTGSWAVALRRELRNRPVRVYETRSLTDCHQALQQSPHSYVALELTVGNVVHVAEWIDQIRHEFPEARVAVLGQRDAQVFDSAVREAGAIYTAYSPRQLGPVARMAWRRIASAPAEDLTFQEQVWRNLPWSSRKEGERYV